MTTNHRNSLTIDEIKEVLCAEHAGRVLAARTWWTIVPNREDSYAQTGDASPFWALVNATLELGQPLGFAKVPNKLGKLVNVPHSDPEQLLRTIIKPDPRSQKPVLEIVEARCKISGKDPKDEYAKRMAVYNEELAAEEARCNMAIKAILKQQPVMDDDGLATSGTVLGAFNEETGEFDEYEVDYGHVSLPIDWVIEYAEKQLKFLASNDRVPDLIFGSEHALWTGELDVLTHIVQQQDNEGAGEGSRAIDEALLDSAGMQAGGNSGK